MSKNFSLGHLLDIFNYGLLAILLAVLQTTLFVRFPIYDALPDLLLGALCCIGIYRGENHGALFGLFSGLCADGLSTTGLSLLPLYYTLLGYVCGRIGDNTREKARFAAFLITIPWLCLTRTALSAFNNLVEYFSTIDIVELALHTLLPEYIYTLLLCIPVFFTVKLFEIPLNIARKRGGLY